jgi:hypothetical protein
MVEMWRRLWGRGDRKQDYELASNRVQQTEEMSVLNQGRSNGEDRLGEAKLRGIFASQRQACNLNVNLTGLKF